MHLIIKCFICWGSAGFYKCIKPKQAGLVTERVPSKMQLHFSFFADKEFIVISLFFLQTSQLNSGFVLVLLFCWLEVFLGGSVCVLFGVCFFFCGWFFDLLFLFCISKKPVIRGR